MTNDEQIKALIEAGEKATPTDKLLVTVTYQYEWGKDFISITMPCNSGDEAQSNRDFIAQAVNSREAIKAMYEENKRLREIAEEMAKIIESIKELWDIDCEELKNTLTKFNAMKG